MSSAAASSTTSDREMAKLRAKANLLLALYSHVAQDLELARAEARIEADLLRRQLAGLHGELESAQQQHAHARAERDSARQQVERLTSDLAHRQRQYDVILSSTSWRITAPVRAVARIATRQ
jgi:hypothetical protein